MSAIDLNQLEELVIKKWDEEITPALIEYIKVPAKSPAFDAQWAENGYLDQEVEDAAQWVKAQGIQGLTLNIIQLQQEDGTPRTPLIYFEVEPFQSDNQQAVFMYGHLDKQPEFSGWSEGRGPWEPKIIDDKLYGRGGADDGYAIYTSAAIVKILQQMNIPHPRIVGVFETCEESGSYDLSAYFEHLKAQIGDVGVVVCLDSGAGNYEQLWVTNALRGMVSGTLRVDVGTQGVHSGEASGVMPSSMRILRHLLERVEDSETGALKLKSAQVEVPANRQQEAHEVAAIIGDAAITRYPWAQGQDGSTVHAMTATPYDTLLGYTWGATLSTTGVEGIPSLANAGNVLRPYTAMKLSFRLPPTADAKCVEAEVKTLLEQDAPYNAKVTFSAEVSSSGWNLNDYKPWLQESLETASQQFFGASCAYIGLGGSIPLINFLQNSFPAAQMIICGVLGPNSNAHGPDEFLHLPYAKKLTAAMVYALANHP